MKTTARLPIPAEVLGLMWISLCAFAAYHAPQPLFPSIQEEFGISQSTVTLITACVLFPLGLAPMFYGILLGRLSMRRTLTTALCLYCIALLPMPLQGNWPMMLAGRCLQGMTLPAIILCVMTYIATHYEGRTLQKYMSGYSFCCIFGGFFGRFIAGGMENFFGEWRLAFLAMALMVATTIPCCRLLTPGPVAFQKPDFTAIGRLLRQNGMAKLLLLTACLAMANNSVLNVLPFRLRELDPSITPFTISLVYTSLIICSSVGLFSMYLIRLLKSEMGLVLSGIVAVLVFIPLLSVHSVPLLGLMLVLFSFGYSFFYVCIPGIINRFSDSEKSVTNGVFISSYYLSGAFGSFLPIIVFENFGFTVYLVCIFLLSCLSFGFAFNMKNTVTDRITEPHSSTSKESL